MSIFFKKFSKTNANINKKFERFLKLFILSILNNNFFILDKSTRNKIFVEFLEDYKVFALKKTPTNGAKTRKCVFGQIFHFFENFVTLKNQLGNFTLSIDGSDVHVTADIIYRPKSFQKLFQNPSEI